MGERDLSKRTKKYALEIIRTVSSLPNDEVSRVIGKQILRSGTSVGAHYRESQRAKSNADLISKMEGGLQELEESAYWLELLQDSNHLTKGSIDYLLEETDELISIFVSIVRKVKKAK